MRRRDDSTETYGFDVVTGFKTVGSRSNAPAGPVWQFDSSADPLGVKEGGAELSYFDPDGNNASASETRAGKSADFDIAPLPDGESGVLEFAAYGPRQGIQLKTNALPNGDYADINRLSLIHI